jgi:hypothetical protein
LALLAVVLCCIITIALAVGAFWQHGVASSKVDDAESYESSAALFRQAESEGQAAGELLQQYVATGDVALIAQINEHTSAGVTKLTAAVQESGIDATPFLEGGSSLVQAEGQIIALRQAGDVQSAIAGLQALAVQFEEFLAVQTTVITSQDAAAITARDDAESADSLTSWMVIGAAVFAIGAMASGILFVRRTASRRTFDALPSA